MSTAKRGLKPEPLKRFAATLGPGPEPMAAWGPAAVPGTAALDPGVDRKLRNLENLREANERLLVAAVTAGNRATEADLAAQRLLEANENLMLATVEAHTLVAVAEQAAVDQAQRAELELKLAEAQKLETLGVLAGGVAHDFNNLLTTIVGNVDLALLSAEGGPMERYLKAIDEAASRAADLVRQLLAYTGHARTQTAEVDLSQVLQEIIHLLSDSLPRNVHVECDLQQRLPFVKADPTQIFQVLLNLVTNASEAFDPHASGAITILAHPVHLAEAVDASGAWLLPLKAGDYATLQVTDNGMGMTPAVLAHIFEPFFTTKFAGRGLGLAAVMGILRSHQGGLHVESSAGRGTSFTLFLPALREPRTLLAPECLPRLQGEGTLLIAGAGGEVRGAARRMAEPLGFTVVEAKDEAEAVDLFRLHHQHTTLVLLDAELPFQGAFQRLKAIDATVPIALTRDYHLPDQEPVPPGSAGLLKHPFRSAEFQGLLERSGKPRPSQPTT